MVPSFLSLVSLYSIYLRRCFTGAGLSPQTVNIDDDETTLHFRGPKPDDGHNKTLKTKKPSLVLIHGFGPDAIWQWRKQVQSFAPHFNVYVPDLIFFGYSATKSKERTEHFQAISVGKLLEKIGVDKYCVAGKSYGGFVAYHVAKMWPERVEKVVIASSGVNMKRSDNEALAKRANLERLDHFMLSKSASQLRTLTGLAVSKNLNIVPNFFFNDFVNDVLIVWEDQDQIFPLKMATELKELLGKKARLEVIENTLQVPQIENPGLFNKIVKNFLSGSL